MAKKAQYVPLFLRLLEGMERNPELHRLSKTREGHALKRACLRDLRRSVIENRSRPAQILKWVGIGLPIAKTLLDIIFPTCEWNLQSSRRAGSQNIRDIRRKQPTSDDK